MYFEFTIKQVLFCESRIVQKVFQICNMNFAFLFFLVLWIFFFK